MLWSRWPPPSGVDSHRRLHVRERLSRVVDSISWVLLSRITPHSGFHYCVQRIVPVNMILNHLPPNTPIVGGSWNISRNVIQKPKLISVIALIFDAIVVWTLHSVVKLTRHKYSYQPPACKSCTYIPACRRICWLLPTAQYKVMVPRLKRRRRFPWRVETYLPHCTPHFKRLDPTTVQAVSRRPLAAEAGIRSQIIPCQICVERLALG
jgi:hypothetical protein